MANSETNPFVLEVLRNLSQSVTRPGRPDPIARQPSRGLAPSGKVSGIHPTLMTAYTCPGLRFGSGAQTLPRPVSAAGEVTCHFAQTSVSKTSRILEMIRVARGGYQMTQSRAAAHVRYVDRPGAPERLDGRGPVRNVPEMTDAMRDRSGLMNSAGAQQAYVERRSAAERVGEIDRHAASWNDEDLDGLETASFGNIGASIPERQTFWEDVEAFESEPRGDTIVITPADDPVWWGRAQDAIATAPEFLQHELRRRVMQPRPAEIRWKGPTVDALRVHDWAVAVGANAPIEISPGRGGRTQTRIIAELPHELDGHGRLRIVRDFCRKLEEKGFPFWAVIHAPGKTNDERNYHVHVSYYDRPAKRIAHPETGKPVWDFTVSVPVRQANRTLRLVSQAQRKARGETGHRAWINELRDHWQLVSNQELERAGAEKRYNLGTYRSMGIDRTPLKHIPAKTFNRERRGEATDDGLGLARRQWEGLHGHFVKHLDRGAASRRTELEMLSEQSLRAVAGSSDSASRTQAVVKLRDGAAAATERLNRFDAELHFTAFVEARIASRLKLIVKADAEAKARMRRTVRVDRARPGEPADSLTPFGLTQTSEAADFLEAIRAASAEIRESVQIKLKAAKKEVATFIHGLKAWIAQPRRVLERAFPGAQLADTKQAPANQRQLVPRHVDPVRDRPVERAGIPPRSSQATPLLPDIEANAHKTRPADILAGDRPPSAPSTVAPTTIVMPPEKRPRQRKRPRASTNEIE